MGSASSRPPPKCKKDGCEKMAHRTQGHGYCCYGCSKGWKCGPLCTSVHTTKCWRCQKKKHPTQGHGYCCWGCKNGTGCRPPCNSLQPKCTDSQKPKCKRDGCEKVAHPTQGHGYCCYGCSKGWNCGPLCTSVHTTNCWRPDCKKRKHPTEGHGYCCWGCKNGTGCGPHCTGPRKDEPKDETKDEPKKETVENNENNQGSFEQIGGFIATAPTWAEICEPHECLAWAVVYEENPDYQSAPRSPGAPAGQVFQIIQVA